MSDTNIKNIMDITMEKLRAVVDADTVIGTPVTAGEVTVIPVSKVSFGVASGGSDFNTKNNTPLFGGGGGAGVTVTPISFLVISGSNVKTLPITNEVTSVERVIDMAPEIIDKAKDLFKKDK